ncbi:MAG: fimbria/pilus periplasmic chaperone [Prolixibacteraceae bacterium]|nr:fimbria/pilus periplasmic chaperone [Prolixibacteraceae bacterium]
MTAVALLLPIFCSAQGDLLVTPRRIVFEGSKQREEITLANTGQDTAYYSISFLQYHMTEDGSFEEITEPKPGQQFADPFLRFFPRSVQLAPGESQVVRMQLRRLPDMADGEYRSHVYFRAVPDEKPLGQEDVLTDSTAIGIRLTPIFGISIPVIVRLGDLSSKIIISDLVLQKEEDQPLALRIVLNREGNQSVYGDLSVDYIGTDGTQINVGLVKGIAVYTPNPLRRFTMPLNIPDGVELNEGKLIVRFSSSSEAEPEIYDEKELGLN